MTALISERVAVVTGAGRGIGAEIADRIASLGYPVAVLDVDAQAASETAVKLSERYSASFLALQADVSDRDSVQHAFTTVRQQLGSVAILVNNAGVISASRFVDLEECEWDRIMSVNAKGTFLCTQAAVPDMLTTGWGRIVNIASDAAKTAEAYIAHYSASKFAVVGLTQSIALEYASAGITSNAVCPAITDTTMMYSLARDLAEKTDEPSSDHWEQAMVEEIPLGRPIYPSDVAAVVAFLISDDAAALTGQAINVSGAHEVH